MVKSQQRLLIVLLATFVLKLLVAAYLPMTGDEAYFITWGKYLDYGFYDHPPMVGWFLSAMLAVSDSALWLRLPQILITSFIGWGIYQLLRRQHEDVAMMAAVLYLLAPINILGVLITTDTPLLLWSFISAWCFYAAQRHDSMKWYFAAGLFLGLAFLSKYFAALLGVAYALYLLFLVRRGGRPWLGLVWVIVGTLPFIALNLWWNYNHCWNNILFNLFNRTSGDKFNLFTIFEYLLTVLYLVTPPIVYYLIRDARSFARQLVSDRFNVFMALVLIPYGLFLLLSFWVTIGLHWLLSFYPFVFIAIATVFSAQQLRRSFYFMLPFSILHLLVFAFLVVFSPGLFKNNESHYKDVVYSMYAEQIVAKLSAYQPRFELATDSYVESALLSYAGRQHIMVFGQGSYHARQDDAITDFRALQGKNILVLSYKSKQQEYAKYFERVEVLPLAMAETHYSMLLGYGFKYPVYRDKVLKQVMQRYYHIPAFLPLGACYMRDKYGEKNSAGQARD